MLTPVSLTRTLTKPITTIDDCASVAQILAGMIAQVAQQKYPLSVRRGWILKAMRKGENMEQIVTSKVIKAGSKTYFFDLKHTKEGKAYLVITESRFQGEGKNRERASLAVFPEHANAFAQTVADLVQHLGETHH